MVIMQSLMVLLYTLVFTLLLSIPLWYFFPGKKRGGEPGMPAGMPDIWEWGLSTYQLTKG